MFGEDIFRGKHCGEGVGKSGVRSSRLGVVYRAGGSRSRKSEVRSRKVRSLRFGRESLLVCGL
jgi:hypothetical protein